MKRLEQCAAVTTFFLLDLEREKAHAPCTWSGRAVNQERPENALNPTKDKKLNFGKETEAAQPSQR